MTSYTTTPTIANRAMSTNSRFPIDLACFPVVEFGGFTNRPPCSRGPPTTPDSNPDGSACMRSRLRAALVLLLTIGLLAYFLRNADMAGVWAETRQADAGLLLMAIALTGLTYALRAYRWQYLLAPIGATHFSTALRNHGHWLCRQFPAAGACRRSAEALPPGPQGAICRRRQLSRPSFWSASWTPSPCCCCSACSCCSSARAPSRPTRNSLPA